MTYYIYIKAPVKIKKQKPLFTKKAIRFLPYLSIISGITLLLMILWPLASYQLLIFSKKQNKPLSPLAENLSKKIIPPLNPVILSAQDNNIQPEIQNEVDYNLIENWFPTAPLPILKPSKITHYTLSIPKLKIKNAIVSINKSKIKKSLIHYPGTALPGEHGNAVVFGHSVLPIFYNPKNYKTIFSTIPTLKKNDEIYIYFDGIKYLYEVDNYFEVKPNEVSVLEQHFNEQTLSLITCVPPGTYLRRGVIKAHLVNF